MNEFLKWNIIEHCFSVILIVIFCNKNHSVCGINLETFAFMYDGKCDFFITCCIDHGL